MILNQLQTCTKHHKSDNINHVITPAGPGLYIGIESHTLLYGTHGDLHLHIKHCVNYAYNNIINCIICQNDLQKYTDATILIIVH